MTRSKTTYRFCKRVFDLIVSVPLLILASPFLAGMTLLVRICLGSPVFWKEKRPGLNGVPFSLIKFRTMTNAHDRDANLLPDAARLTRVGRVLRSTSLDELPELLNVIAGDMSLVGPRPLLLRYLQRYTPKQMRRHEVPPGITGWAQVNGRNALTWDQKFALDLWYVENCSFWTDLRILAMTVWKLITREGISQCGYATAEEFFGSPKY